MLSDRDAVATIAVKDLKVAGKFYTETLGLRRGGGADEPGTLSFATGKTTMLVYESKFAGTNQATAATWFVGEDLDALVQQLRSRGVTFEHYHLPDTKRHGDIHVSGKTKVAWFKDPDGNIHALVNG